MSADPIPPLKGCPFCGKSHTIVVMTSAEFAEDNDFDDDNSDYRAVLCDARTPGGPGGCGACSGFRPTEAEAIAAWNARAESQRPTTDVPTEPGAYWVKTPAGGA